MNQLTQVLPEGANRRARRAPPVAAPGRLNAVAIRALDVVLAGSALVFLAPLLLLIAIMVFAFDPGPVLFAQNRIGHGNRRFKCYKFRTMVMDAEGRLAELLRNDPVARAEWEVDHKLRKDPRIIGIGGLLRKSSLDELPQLLNVLLGSMSLVGPRPIVEAEVQRYGTYFRHYCSVKPGITGLWQISGRNDVSYRRRVAFDVAYSRSQSLRLNMKIILLTVPSVCLARGSY